VRTYTAVDDCGHSASGSYTVKVTDSVAPVLSHYPEDQVVECDSIPAECEVHALPSCDGSSHAVTVEETGGNGGPIYRKWTSTDDCGNKVVHTQTITVSDTSAPIFSRLPGDETVGCDCDTFPAAPTMVAIDNCEFDGKVSYEEVTIHTSSQDEYTLKRTWTASDAAGNEVSHTQTITVEDKEAPQVALDLDVDGALPGRQVVCDGGSAPTITNYDAFVRDNCDDSPDVSSFASGSVNNGCAADYTVTHTWSMTDRTGNNGSFSQEVHVVDDSAPKFVGTAECVKGLENGGKVVFQNFINSLRAHTSDNCGAVTFGNSVTCNSTDTDSSTDCSFANGALTVYSKDYGVDVATFNVYATARDTCGNTADIKQRVVVPRPGAYAFAGVSEVSCKTPQ